MPTSPVGLAFALVVGLVGCGQESRPDAGDRPAAAAGEASDPATGAGGGDSSGEDASGDGSPEVVVPSADDFTDRGEVVPLGSSGAWDRRIDGAFNVVGLHKRTDGTLHLYYVGADGDRPDDGGPRHRRLGAATSTDGLTWSRHPDNPLVTYSPNGGVEEGIFSGGMWAEGETLYAMLGAMEGTGGKVDGSGDLYTSTDGITWSVAAREVIDPRGGAIGDDENFPFAAYEHEGTKHVFYAAKGRGITNWSASLASGGSWDDLTSHTNLRGQLPFHARAGGAVIRQSASTYLLPVTNASDERVEIYAFDPTDPTSLTPVEAWPHGTFGMTATTASNEDNGLLYLDRELETWFFFYVTGSGPDGTGIHLATAPARLP